ncbi:MAG: hypothetical protein JXR61_00040 [Prolixibacteraceae bacterium]|nr:hypothetical protein [Prolixibacteraceae bacterium]
MAKILGLDLGTNSIGWAVVEKEDGEYSLLDKGVRIFQRGYGDEHQDVSRASERTRIRSARKLIYRRKGRKIELLRLLGSDYHPISDEELIAWHKSRKYPIRKEIQDWFKLNPYELRNEAIDGNKLSNLELGRIFYHFTQRRGFRSNKKDVSSYDEDNKNLPKDLVYHQKYLKTHGEKSVSKILFEKHKKAERIRNTSEKNEISRITLQDDFLLICQKQTLSPIFTEQLRKIIFDARPLKSQKGNIGKCVFEKNKPRCPVSSIEFEEYRMYSFINNIKIKRKGEDKKEFKSLYEQQYIENAIEIIKPLFYRQKSTFKFADIHDKLDKAGLYDFNYNDITTVSGCPVSAHLKKFFGDDWKAKRFCNGENSKGEKKYIDIRDIWHMLFDHYMQDKKDEPLLELAQKKLNIDPNDVEKFISAPIKQGYSNLSFKAIGKIMPFLKSGFRLDQAIIFANIPTILGLDKNDELPDDIYEDILDIFNSYGDEKMRNTILNDCISIFRNDFKNAHSNYQIDAIDKKIIENQTIKKFGEKTWSEFSEEEQKKFLIELENNFENQLRQGGFGGQFIKTDSIKQKVKDYLANTLGIATHLTDKVYHPSAIELYEKVEYNNEGLRLLGSPIVDSIKNPLFMRAMCELRKVVNELLKNDIIDNETQIVVELGRNVNDYNMRKAIERYQRERETENEFYKHLLEEFYKEKNIKKTPSTEEGQRVKFWVEQLEDEQDSVAFYTKLEEHTAQYTKKEDRIKLPQYAIEKYRLWREQKGICPYTHNPIGMAELLNGNKFDFEHTVPLSKSFDNSLANKTIAQSYFNRYVKGNKAPFELEDEYRNNVAQFIERWENKVDDLEKRIEKLKGKAKSIQDKERKNQNIQERHYLRLHLKYWKTKVNNFKLREITDGFKNRQFTDISIINKYALMYLKSAFDNVSNINSRFIDEYRNIVGYSKSRDNHTHHTIDAIFCACSVDFARKKPEALAKLEKYYTVLNQYKKAVWFDIEEAEENTRSLSEQMGLAKTNLVPWENFRNDLNDISKTVLVSHRFNDKFKKQTKKKIRERGKIVHRAIKVGADGNVLEWKYKTDSLGNKIPVKGKKVNENPDFVIHQFKEEEHIKVEVLTDLPEFDETTIRAQGYLFVKDKNDEIVYEKDARYTWHNDRENSSFSGVRSSLHKEMFYGRVKRQLTDDKGNSIFEDWYVKRMPVDKLTSANLKNIVDEGIKQRISDNGGLKSVRSKGVIILPATEHLKEMKIKTIRCRQVKAQGFLTGIPLKNNTHLSQKHEMRLKLFGENHKLMSYIDNDGNYQLGIYSDGKNFRYKFLNNLDASRLLRDRDNIVKVDNNYLFNVRGKKVYMELTQLLHTNLYALLLHPNESFEDVSWEDRNQLMQRLYEIKGFGESGNYAVIFCLHNQCAEKISSLSVKDGIFELNKVTIKYRKFLHTNFHALIEGIDFKIDPLGNIKRLT